MVDERVASSVGMGVTQSIGLWLALTPALKDVYATEPDDGQFAATMRHGEIVAGTASVAIGIMASLLSGSTLPLLTAFVTVAVLYGVYEYTLVREVPNA